MSQLSESVWDYPRPPRVESTARVLRVVFAGTVVAETSAGWRVLETSHPPVYYFPPGDVALEYLVPSAGPGTVCEWKGGATYWDVQVGARSAKRIAWSYRNPVAAFEEVQDHVAFYPQKLECFVDDERVTPQPGGFYGGWITQDVVGPFKGGPGSAGW